LWPSIALAFIVFVFTMSYYGWVPPFPNKARPPHYFMQQLQMGMLQAPMLAYLAPAILLGLGSSLGTRNALRSLVFVLIGVVSIALGITALQLWSLLTTPTDMFAAPPPMPLPLLILLSFTTTLMFLEPVLIGAVAVAFLVHFIWSWLDRDHGPWFFGSKPRSLPGHLFDAGIGIVVLYVAIWAFAVGDSHREKAAGAAHLNAERSIAQAL